MVKGSDGEQTIPVLKFFKNHLFAALGPQALVVEVHVPKHGSKIGWSSKEFTRRVETG